jgi:DNA mismatch repair ATPase MutS
MELDQTHGDLYSAIQELEFYFISIIQMEISKNQQMLLDINRSISMLDAYLSLLMATIEFRLVPPTFIEGDKPLKICKGRNLLVEFQNQEGFAS